MSSVYKEWAVLHAKYDLLEPPIQKGSSFSIAGLLPVIDRNGTVWDRFSVLIDILSDYPSSLPTITEIGGRIPRSEQWHINADKTCCVGTVAEQYRKLHGRMNLLNWVDEFAIPFLANYIYKKEKGIYFNGEWPHGVKGIYADYAQLFGIADLGLLLQRMRYCCGSQSKSFNADCFCNSGKKYKRCYLIHIEQHRHYIPKKVIWRDVSLLEKFQKLR